MLSRLRACQNEGSFWEELDKYIISPTKEAELTSTRDAGTLEVSGLPSRLPNSSSEEEGSWQAA